jgi:hypothetical protein
LMSLIRKQLLACDLAMRSRVPDRLFVGISILIILWNLWAMLPDVAR